MRKSCAHFAVLFALACELTEPLRARGEGGQATWLQATCDDTPGCDNAGICLTDNHGNCKTPGTLFQWSGYASEEGGPDLSSPLVTDRPDFTEASSTVGRGVSQIEFGYTYVYDDDGATTVREHSFGEPLLRQGVFADWLEFRIAVAPLEERTSAAGSTSSKSGVSDLYLGFKIGLTPQVCWLPEMAVIPQWNVPTGSDAFSSDEVEPGLNWIYGWEINDFLSTAGSTQGNRRLDDTGEAYLEMAQSWTVAYSLTDNLGAYTEWFGIFPSGADTARVENYFNGGFTYLFTDNLQFDIRAGVGLNDSAADYFLGSGLSVRIP
ncbi:MAG: transporter [Planctomycetales bacterium]|nr:transporter [Planctomycetales bacterium]